MLFIPQVMLSLQIRPKGTIVVEKVVLQRRLKLSPNNTKVIAPLLCLTDTMVWCLLQYIHRYRGSIYIVVGVAVCGDFNL